MNRNVGIVETSRHFGVTLSAVVKWCEKGCPHDETYKGIKPVKKFDIDEVSEWITQQRK